MTPCSLLFCFCFIGKNDNSRSSSWRRKDLFSGKSRSSDSYPYSWLFDRELNGVLGLYLLASLASPTGWRKGGKKVWEHQVQGYIYNPLTFTRIEWSGWSDTHLHMHVGSLVLQEMVSADDRWRSALCWNMYSRDLYTALWGRGAREHHYKGRIYLYLRIQHAYVQPRI